MVALRFLVVTRFAGFGAGFAAGVSLLLLLVVAPPPLLLPVVAVALAGSTAPPCSSHAFQPPSRARALKFLALRIRAARALVFSFGQAQ